MNLVEAEIFFKGFKCSQFSMARENLEQYEKYKALKIPKETEKEWRGDEFFKHLNIVEANIESNGELFEVWYNINNMCELVEDIKDINLIKLIYKLIVDLFERLSINNRIIIAETIIGRKNISCRSGLIFLSYDLNDKELSNSFFQLSLKLLDVKAMNDEDSERLEQNKKKCVLIKKELNM